MDIDYLLSLQAWREGIGGALDRFFLLVSELGMPTLPLILCLICYWSIHKQTGVFLLFACNIGDWLNGVVKLCCCVYRPWVRDARILPVSDALPGASGYSFPSGHSTKAASFYGGLAWRLRRKKVWAILCVLLAPLVMFSRNYLGVHTPQDVLAGLTVGLVGLIIVQRMTSLAESKPRTDVPIALGTIVICALSILFVSLKAYPLDYTAEGALLVNPEKMKPDTYTAAGAVIGMMTGWLLERRKVGFVTQGVGWLRRALRALTGVAVALLVYMGLGKALTAGLGASWGGFICTTLLCFYALGLHPVLFTLAEKLADQRKNAAEKETPV